MTCDRRWSLLLATGVSSTAAAASPDGTAAIQVEHLALSVDLASGDAEATLTIASTAPGWLAVDLLEIDALRGAELLRRDAGRIWLKPKSTQIYFHYKLAPRNNDGWLPSGATRTWPDFCGRLFPCNPNPDDGLTWDLDVHGAPPGQRVIAPSVHAPAPSYMLAWAVGAMVDTPIGKSRGGVSLWAASAPDQVDAALRDTEHLVAGFSFFEDLLGPYPYGNLAGPVAVDWGDGAYGGMEHHPRWHVSADAASNAETNLHEAAHGWFGDAVRLRCWQDLVLSEGAATYLAIRAHGAIFGADAERQRWEEERATLQAARATDDQTAAWPVCSGKDPLPLRIAPYSAGALVLHAIEHRIGRPTFDLALRTFVDQRRGTAAGMADLLAHLQRASPARLDDLAAQLRDPNFTGVTPTTP